MLWCHKNDFMSDVIEEKSRILLRKLKKAHKKERFLSDPLCIT